jgi:N-carbamoyl-L-amino-acid hydrolase
MTPLQLAATLFDRLREASRDEPGVTRESFGPREQAAHDIMAEAARSLGLEVSVDAIGTLRMLLPGADPALPPVAVGSHLDAVPHGGNFDGAAGVVLGLAAAMALREAPRRRGLLLLGIRAEEMCWFPASYLGSRALFGLLPLDAPEALRRADSGRMLAEHMAELGLDPAPIRARRALLAPSELHAFIEPHIEQGPVLVEEGLPVAVVTGIRGSLRYPRAGVTGRHAHAGAVPRGHRRDAALAGVELVAALDRRWQALEEEGADLVCTVGILSTDPAHHTPTKVPGLLRFSLDIRSEDAALLAALDVWLAEEAARIGAARGVAIDLGPPTHTAPARMDAGLIGALEAAARATATPFRRMASGAGHDSMIFAAQGVPTAMLFLRNRNGSHNPDEALDPPDIAAGLAVLTEALRGLLA